MFITFYSVSNRACACPETGEKPEPLNTCISDAIDYVRERLADDDDDNDDNVDDDDESARRGTRFRCKLLKTKKDCGGQSC